MVVYYVTIATSFGGYIKFLLQSCERHKIKLEILGLGQQWKGFAWRWLLLEEFLKNKTDDDIICFLDSYDVIANRNPELYIKFMFLKTGKEFLVSRETFAHPLLEFIFKNCGGVWEPIDDVIINAGTWMATKRAFLKMLNGIRSNKEYNFNEFAHDQKMLCKYIKNNRDDFAIDFKSKIFFVNVSPIFEFMYNKNVKIKKSQLRFNGKTPFFIHGPAKTNMNNVLEKLGYALTESEKKSLKNSNEIIFKIIIGIILIIIMIVIIRK